MGVLDIQRNHQESQELYRDLLALREKALGPNPRSPSLGEGLMLQGKFEAVG
jgi:hypothetical protein